MSPVNKITQTHLHHCAQRAIRNGVAAVECNACKVGAVRGERSDSDVTHRAAREAHARQLRAPHRERNQRAVANTHAVRQIDTSQRGAARSERDQRGVRHGGALVQGERRQRAAALRERLDGAVRYSAAVEEAHLLFKMLIYEGDKSNR